MTLTLILHNILWEREQFMHVWYYCVDDNKHVPKSLYLQLLSLKSPSTGASTNHQIYSI